jgi:uncharacterized protein (DUF302 family)
MKEGLTPLFAVINSLKIGDEMKKILIGCFFAVCLAGTAAAQGGLVNVKSNHSVLVTTNRLESALKEKGIIVFARIDHAAGAQKVGKELKPTMLLIFGNPAMGTPMIQRSRTAGIDLPLKTLIWEDRTGQVWLTYNSPDYIARRHGLAELDDLTQKMGQALSTFSAAATLP